MCGGTLPGSALWAVFPSFLSLFPFFGWSTLRHSYLFITIAYLPLKNYFHLSKTIFSSEFFFVSVCCLKTSEEYLSKQLNLRILAWRQILPASGGSLLLRSFHQASLTKDTLGFPLLIVDGGRNQKGELLGDVVSLSLAPFASSATSNMFAFNGLSHFVQLWYPTSLRRTYTTLTFEAMFRSTANVVDGATLFSWAAVAGGNIMRIFIDYATGNICVGPGDYNPENPISCGSTRLSKQDLHFLMF